MSFLNNVTPEHILSILLFISGVIVICYINKKYSDIFKSAAEKNPEAGVKEAGITFVSGHFLAFFIMPFCLIVGASLAIVGKLDSGIAAIIGMIIGYIVNKVVVR